MKSLQGRFYENSGGNFEYCNAQPSLVNLILPKLNKNIVFIPLKFNRKECPETNEHIASDKNLLIESIQVLLLFLDKLSYFHSSIFIKCFVILSYHPYCLL